MPLLTTRRIDSEKADPTTDRRIADSLGLYLKVAKNGNKTFTYRYTYANRRFWLHLGTYPETSLSKARDARLAAGKLLESGKNPLYVEHTAQKAKKEALDVSELIEEFRIKFLEPRFDKPAEAYRTLFKDIGSEIGRLLVPDVTKKEVAETINKIVLRGARVQANRTLTLVRQMFEYAKENGMIEENPVVMTRKSAGGKEKTKVVNLSFDQIQTVIRSISNPLNKVSWQTRLALLFCLATAKRPGEIVTLKWEHINMEASEWINPSALTKEKHGDHMVYLNNFAIDLLKEAQELGFGKPHVFPSFQREVGHIDRHSMSRAILRLWASGDLPVKFTPHDFRRTFSTRMADLGEMPHIVEKILDHLMEGVMAVYNRATYLPERKAAMKIWGNQLSKLSKR